MAQRPNLSAAPSHVRTEDLTEILVRRASVRRQTRQLKQIALRSSWQCARRRRRPGLPRTPRPFLPVGPSPPRFWGLAAPRGATRGNRLNSSRLASVSNRTLDCLASLHSYRSYATPIEPADARIIRQPSSFERPTRRGSEKRSPPDGIITTERFEQ